MNVGRTFGGRALLESAALLPLLALSAAVYAQEKPTQLANSTVDEHPQEVVITGSRIARPDLDRLQPTTVVGAATFDEREFLRRRCCRSSRDGRCGRGAIPCRVRAMTLSITPTMFDFNF